jgi:DNA polymerase sigma
MRGPIAISSYYLICEPKVKQITFLMKYFAEKSQITDLQNRWWQHLPKEE